ncbi:hypothetical protein BKA69DRAFT_7568 [Paraphysoderma sedebokerense]|nr:hypothetical protein BKA69DRAFT_7568 [Paraphysoderma sedebokerense]
MAQCNIQRSTTISPPSLWGLFPSFWATIPFAINDIQNLVEYNEYPDVYFMLNHPIRAVAILGVVVGKDITSNFNSYLIDDSTGLINVIQWIPTTQRYNQSRRTFELGDSVIARGKLGHYRGERQIVAWDIDRATDPNAESFHRLQCLKLRKQFYDKPFVLPDSISKLVPNSSDPNATTSDSISHGIQDPLILQFLKNAVVKFARSCRNYLFTIQQLQDDENTKRLIRQIMSKKTMNPQSIQKSFRILFKAAK